MTKNYDYIKAEFIRFLSDPERTETQAEFAKKYEVDPATLSIWKRDPEFKQELIDRLEEYLGDSVADVYKTIRKKAKEGDYNFTKLLLQQINLLKAEKQEMKIDLVKPLLGGVSVSGNDSDPQGS